MEIGWPTNVKHITHVTFDRFNGFLGLPVEFELEIPGRVPSARSEGTMGNFENELNTMVFRIGSCVRCLAGIDAMLVRFEREQRPNNTLVDAGETLFTRRPKGRRDFSDQSRKQPGGACVLDGLSPEKVLQCNTEQESVDLVKQMKSTEAALLNWAVDLMADVVEEEESNKMNARNIAMVFAPNMTQMSDPLTALMHAVLVMNLLKTLIMKALQEREESLTRGGYSSMSSRTHDGLTDKEFDSNQEMETSCELKGPTSEYDNALYNNYSGDEDEVKSLGEIEACFLRQLDENSKNVTNRFFGETS
ncbi:peroxidase 3 isoform 1 [Hibiscus syriacus]|uniref:Peroxidase 3 isoform 1 n=1 Tax=Hibiscus syriacus TaxID=106335 RepID=A0A6A2ZDG9_HIBSY|nr:peroxidase 3 isoform 1 [Hibiscus syriacus]